MFYSLNGQGEPHLSLSRIDTYFQNQPIRTNAESKNLVRELQKYIDKYHFSL
jgi:hypothetical protein